MPYNFEATFTLPIIKKLDSGQIKNADDWARTITDAYIRTIRTGLPGSPTSPIPPTLPSPTAQGAPFVIGNTPPVITNAARARMFNVIKAYFQTKELTFTSDSLVSMLQIALQLKRKLETKTTQLRTLLDEARLIEDQIREAPNLIRVIVDELQNLINEEKTQLEKLFQTIEGISLELNESPSDTIFKQEKAYINDIRNLDFRRPGTIPKIIQLYASLGGDTGYVAQNTSTREVRKAYVITKLRDILKNLIVLGRSSTNPTILLDYYNTKRTQSEKIKALLIRIQQLQIVQQVLIPKLQKLEEKIQDQATEIKFTLKGKINQLEESIKNRQTENEATEKGLISVYKKVQSDVKEVRSKLKDLESEKRLRLESTQAKIKKITAIAKNATGIGIKLAQLVSNGARELNPSNNINLQIEAVTLNNFINANGLQLFANELTLLVVESSIAARDIIDWLNRQKIEFTQIQAEVKTLISDIDNLTNPKPIKLSTPKKVTLLQVLKDFCGNVQLKISNTQKTLQDELTDIKLKVKNKISRIEEDLIDYIDSVRVSNSVVDDNVVSLQELESISKSVEDYGIRSKDIKNKLSLLASASKAAIKLTKNIIDGKYTVSDNQTIFNNLVDNYYTYLCNNKTQDEIVSLKLEAERTKDKIKKLEVLEGVGTGLKLMLTEGGQDQRFKLELQQLENKYNIRSLSAIFDLNPSNLNLYSIKDLANQTTLVLVQSATLLTDLIALENKFLAKSKQAAASYIDIVGNESAILKLLIKMQEGFQEVTMKLIGSLTDKVDNLIAEQKTKLTKLVEERVKQSAFLREKLQNVDALVMSAVFGLSARLLWTGLTWPAPTGTTYQTITIGQFKQMKASLDKGASGFVREMAAGFERQLKQMTGLVTPPPPTGITPFPFKGFN